MTSGNDLINNNWKAAECKFYEGGTALAVNVAVASLVTGQFWGTIAASAGGLAFEYAAGLAGCTNNPGQPEQGSGRCKEVDGCGNLYAETTDQGWLPLPTGSNATEARKVNSVTFTKGGGGCRAWQWYVQVDAVACDGSPTSSAACYDYDYTGEWELRPQAGSTCTGSQPGPLPPGAIGEPTTVADGECNWTITPKDSFIDDQGLVNTYWVIEADNDACGGPFAYWSTANGPTPVAPVRPDGKPDPIPPKPKPCSDCPDPLELAQATYQMQGVCEDVDQGQAQPVAQWPIPSARYEQALAARIDALASMLQQHLEWRTPTCNARPKKEGEFRTISFVSDETSPNGRDRVHKRFRYRSVSGIRLAGVVDHWRAFTWQAGPVCVAHKGAYWGTPQVWAATAEEGKRVIRHAALEAGLDPDQTGGWVISGSDNPRYGMPGTMKVNTSGGYYWITERLGSDARPQVEQT